jgi:hypothetical protein
VKKESHERKDRDAKSEGEYVKEHSTDGGVGRSDLDHPEGWAYRVETTREMQDARASSHSEHTLQFERGEHTPPCYWGHSEIGMCVFQNGLYVYTS